MNLKDIKLAFKFLYKILDIIDIKDTDSQIEINDNVIKIYCRDNNKELKYVMELKYGSDYVIEERLSVISSSNIRDELNTYYSNRTKFQNAFEMNKKAGAVLFDTDNQKYEFMRSSHFNISMNKNLGFSYDEYKEIINECKKLKTKYWIIIKFKE